MREGLVKRKRSRISSLNWPWTEARGEARSAGDQGTEARTAHAEPERPATGLGPPMEAVVDPGNLRKALARVRRNKGAPGLDGMTVDDLGDHLKNHWPEIRSRLLDGSYTPQPVRRVEIPKASGGVRPLGVPTVLDRFIQQAAMQVLQGDWDPSFSDASYGFRPGRSAHRAVERAQDHIRAGFDIVVEWSSRSGEVLRSGQSRHPDGSGGQTGGRQTPARADPRLPDRGRAGEWAGRPDRQGDATGRAALPEVASPIRTA